MSQALKLTKTQNEALKLMANGAEMIGEVVNGRKFGFDTVSFLKRRKFITHKDPNYNCLPEVLVITERGRNAFEGKLKAKFTPTKYQKEILSEMASGENMLWALKDNIYAYYLGEKAVNPTTISALQKQQLIQVLIKGNRSDSKGNGYSITEIGAKLVNENNK